MAGRIVIVGLGPAGPELLTAEASAAIHRVPTKFLRTARHRAAAGVVGATAFDALYESGDTFEAVYRGIVDELIAAASVGPHGREVLYAVPGSPMVAERTVEMLRKEAPLHGIELEIQPALSFVDLAWSRLGVDPLAEGVRIIDGHRFATQAAGDRGPLLVTQCHSGAVLSDIKLSVEGPPPGPVMVLQRLGLPDESVRAVAWTDLDRAIEPDHLTSVYIPRLTAPVANELVRLDELMHRLRLACPWDREQTHASLAGFAIEEAHEVVEAIAELGADGAEPSGEAIDHFQDELGDLLLQVVFHACIGAENGWFTLADIAQSQHDKLVYRHPWVFPREGFDAKIETSADVVANWARAKRKSPTSA